MLGSFACVNLQEAKAEAKGPGHAAPKARPQASSNGAYGSSSTSELEPVRILLRREATNGNGSFRPLSFSEEEG